MNIAILTANLGSFDTPVDPVPQLYPEGVEVIKFKRWTDENYPPIAGLTPRLQYRIPKMFGWEMFPDFDVYIWLDGSFSMLDRGSVKWLYEQLGDSDVAFFKHPQRNSMLDEAYYIRRKLNEGNKYMVPRYQNGLHIKQVAECYADSGFEDNVLYTSTAFIYRNNKRVQDMFKIWWYYQSKYFTCDQVSQPYAVYKSRVKVSLIEKNQYKIPYLSLVSRHK